MTDALAAEWLKLRTARSTGYCLGVVALFIALMAVLAWYAAHLWDGLPPARRSSMELSSLPELACWVDYLVMGVLGVLAITSEYSSGMIRATLTVLPRRRTVLAAKAGVVAVVALAAGEVTGFTVLAAARLIVGDRPIHGQEPHVGRIVTAGVVVMVFALLGLSLGTLLRSTAGAIVVVAGLWHIVPVLVQLVPEPWGDRLGSLLPAALVEEIAGSGGQNSIYGKGLPPAAAVAVLVAYAVVPLGAAGIALARRDVP
ncbi:ABC transporter permease subunit [Actinoallomurus spadix]|uniref:ABC transporter permease n=1 Tax=Actinoallomurus spadix TaxID=79912 RepID=A0ABN0X3A9_9ACTN|nr:ABC transporter permease subunit [Actinoallomurus spadix]MCO5986019.1 ABC transporter permease subunit [Actinoallomurus spadix]